MARLPSNEEITGHLTCQKLAMKAAHEVASMLQPGWTEIQAAEMLNTYLMDSGVKSFFHRSFIWFGDRTRFAGVKNYKDYLPTSRIIRENDSFILDVAPILNGHICDIGVSGVLGHDENVENGLDFLNELYIEIPKLFDKQHDGASIWLEVDRLIIQAGYDNIHSLYPFGVLGHRVPPVKSDHGDFRFLNFGWQSYWEILSRGIFGQLLNKHFKGDKIGLWAIEPHIGGQGWGAKFEEILLVTEDGARWIAATEASQCLLVK